MTDKRLTSPANQNVPVSSVRPSPFSFDVRNHLRARQAVNALLDRQKKVFIARSTHSKFGREVRILLDGKYYDCNERELARIQEGARPEDIGVEEVPTYDHGADED